MLFAVVWKVTVTERAWLGDLTLGFASLVLIGLAAPPWSVWPIGLVAWVPLVVLASSGCVSRATTIGWGQGAVAQAVALGSMAGALRHAGGTTLGASVVLMVGWAIFEGGRFGLIVFATARACRNGWPLVLAFPMALVGAECIYPLFFPWNAWLYFEGVPVLLQGAEVGGPLAISLWVGVLNASLATAWRRRSSNQAVVTYAMALPLGVLTLVVLFGAVRMNELDERIRIAPELRIGLVQGNVANIAQSGDPANTYREASLDLIHREKVDLLVWPETSMSYPVDVDRLSAFLSEHVFRGSGESRAMQLEVPLLAGMVTGRSSPDSPTHVQSVGADGVPRERTKGLYNSAVLATPNGRVLGVYDKRALVMFGEYVPAIGAQWFRHVLPSAGSFSSGTSSEPLSFLGKRILVLICYEDILTESVRTAVKQGDPDLLMNLTSDAWFGQSRAQWFHVALARLRAVEHRRFLVHATSTGSTAIVDPVGRITTLLPSDQRASAVGSVRWMRAKTLYEILGDAPGWVAASVALVFAARRRQVFRTGSAAS